VQDSEQDFDAIRVIVAPTNRIDGPVFHVKHSRAWVRSAKSNERMNLYSLSHAEIAKNHVEHIFDVDPTGQPAQRPRGQPQLLGDQLFLVRLQGAL